MLTFANVSERSARARHGVSAMYAQACLMESGGSIAANMITIGVTGNG